MMKIIINHCSGLRPGVLNPEHLHELFHSDRNGVEVHVARSGDELIRLARRMNGADDDLIVAGGGDGTINTIASHLAGTTRRLGILPLGTFNHFARDLGVPSSLEEAARVIREGHSIDVDVAELNGRIFLNNSSVGFYPAVVRLREQLRQEYRRGKWTALASAVVRAFWRFQLIDLEVSIGGKHVRRRTPFLFVGNNQYLLESSRIGTRARLDAGHLCVFVARPTRRVHFMRLCLRTLLGRAYAKLDFDEFTTAEALIQSPRRHLSAALDGEVTRMETPLHYRICPKALRVIVPAHKSDER